jgi:type I restriction enzyme S subunit
VSSVEAATKEGLQGRFKPYPAYKDSGVEWLGEIPEHWGVKCLKRLVKFQGGGTPSKDNLDYWQGDIPWVSPKDMKESLILDTEDKITTHAVRESATKLIAAGAVLIVVRSGILVHSIPVALAGCNVALNQDMKAMIPCLDLDPAYLMHLISGLQRELLVEWKKDGATVESLDLESVQYSPTPLPPIYEQRVIATFLDRETARIDALVAKKQRLIELLHEQRTALITRAVTKGLDGSVPMKESGVEWLGEIPADWEVKKIKRLCLVRRGASPRPIEDQVYFDDEGEYAWVRIADVTASERYLEETTQRLSELGRSKSVPLDPGELFVSIAGTVGKPIITRIKCCIHDGFVYFVYLRESREYLYYLFSCGEPYKGLGKLGTQLNLNTDTIGDIYLPRPSMVEQERIVSYLDAEAAKINALIGKVLDAITKLGELRAALISAAVTGKIDVREEVR